MTIELPEEDKIKVVTADDLYGIMQRILLREEKIDQDKSNQLTSAGTTIPHNQVVLSHSIVNR